MEILIKYFSEDYPRLKKIEQGDWIDLRVDSLQSATNHPNDLLKCGEVIIPKGEVVFVGLGVAMQLPEGYEAYVVPRSSLFKNTGLILTNGVGIIDNSYSGDNDEWMAMLYATRDCVIRRHDRLLQFRIQRSQPELTITEVDKLDNEDRGGYGSTGVK